MKSLSARSMMFFALAALLAAVGLTRAVSADSHTANNVVVFNTPVGADAPGPLLPGSSYTATFSAERGDTLSFATMLVQSNDWFFAPNQWGIALYDQQGRPRTGDITRFVHLLDSGTEVDQTPGSGADQAPRQAGPNTGAADPHNMVRFVHGGIVPPVNQLVRATLSYANGEFTLNIANVSGNSSFGTPLAPGVVVLHRGQSPLFAVGQADRGQGLEALAEDGNPAILAASLTNNAPTAPANNAPAAPTNNAPAAPAGNAEKSAVFAVPVGADGPGPLLPGHAYEFSVQASRGDYLHFATMFVQSNDWFFSPSQRGIALYNADGSPKTGDITSYVRLYDSGTEIDQTAGSGVDQAPRQAGPDAGAADPNNAVRRAHDDSGMVPGVEQLIRVMLNYDGNGVFTVNIANISGSSDFATPLAPGVGLATRQYAPIFQSSFPDRGQGLEALAEDGNPAILAEYLMK